MSVKQVIVVRTDLNMRKGKMIAQGAHASLKVFLDHGMLIHDGDKPSTLQIWPVTTDMAEWLKGSFTKICVGVESEEAFLAIRDAAVAANLYCAAIQDTGRTEFHMVPTWTALAIGPDKAEDIDKITGHLKLL